MDKIDFLHLLPKQESDQQDRTAKPEIRFGSLCPKCLKGIFDYDGLLNLVCPNCGFKAGGCFT